MTPDEANVTMKLLERTQLQGKEVMAYAQVNNALLEIAEGRVVCMTAPPPPAKKKKGVEKK